MDTSLLNSLHFASLGVADTDYKPELQHVQIAKGEVRSFNGMLAMCAPLPLDLSICPQAALFARALRACSTTTPQLTVTASGNLIVADACLSVEVPCCSANSFPRIEPAGVLVTANDTLLDALLRLLPFVSIDTSRPWANGILLKGESAYATDNTILVEHWIGGHSLPITVNVPRVAVQALLACKERPTMLQVCEQSLTFHFTAGKWLRTQLHTTTWPAEMLIAVHATELPPVPAGLFAALAQLAPFALDEANDDRGVIRVEPGQISTPSRHAIARVAELSTTAQFDAKALRKLEGLVTHIALNDYPRPCRFAGPLVRGLLLGRVVS